MSKILIGLFTGMILTAALFWVAWSINPITVQSDDSCPPETPTDTSGTFNNAFNSSLQEAGKNIQDEEMAQFYQKLLQEYELDDPSSWTTPDESSDPEDVIPDVGKISHTALTLPLQEAGKNIRDEEIAQFYYNLLRDAGWTIESDY
jgi:hypothetical protein